MGFEGMDQKHMDSISLGKVYWEMKSHSVGEVLQVFILFPVLKASVTLAVKKPIRLILALSPD